MKEYVVVSSKYGLHLYQIYQAVFELTAIGVDRDKAQLCRWLSAYDQAWDAYRALPSESPQCATLYFEKGGPKRPAGPGLQKFLDPLRTAAKKLEKRD